MKLTISTFLLLFALTGLYAQADTDPCTHTAILQRHLDLNPNAAQELLETEASLQKAIKDIRTNAHARKTSTYTIPVVMHVFHFGEDGKMDMEQAQSGLKILNDDFNGLNDAWNTIDPAFDPIKGTLDINFCLATIDPDGNPTTGLIYHEDEDAMLNQGDLFQHAWDNFKYLNIYFPKYTGGGPSNFTAYAFYPSNFNTENDRDGIFYSSIRWGYGNHSELDDGDDWASVCSHEVGHWLNLRHTFEGGCSGQGDLVADTPPTEGGTIELAGCTNYDQSCNEATNGENFMDYNHRCKKMFTQGQVERMTAALELPSRINLWSEENLLATGCLEVQVSQQENYPEKEILIYPNPAKDFISFILKKESTQLSIFNAQGQLLDHRFLQKRETRIAVNDYAAGIYFYSLLSEGMGYAGKFVVEN